MYLILWKSPKQMRIYKFLLLNISVWAFITDMLLEIISLPLPVLEVFGLYSVGLSRFLPSPVGFASVVATMFCIFEYLVGLMFAFYHRYYVLQDEVSILGKTVSRGYFYLAIVFTTIVPPGTATLALGLSSVPFADFKDQALRTHPELAPFFHRVPIFGLNLTAIMAVCAVTCFWVVLWTSFVIWCVVGILTQFRMQKTSMSNFNYQLHVQLIKALAVQTLVPLLLYAVPLFTLAICFIFKLSILNDAFKITELALSLHSIVNSLAVILLIAPYRRFEFYRCCMAVTAALSIPLTALVVYLILWKSPKQMRTYKFLLLNISVWAFITDMLLEIISLPLPVLEVFGLYSVGLSRSLPSPVGFASVVATMFCIFEYLVGLMFAFYHRYYVLQDEPFRQ
ncbi:hypothetical protein QR680_015602 [Steinernema hermaphroditum]|uniref:G-protein coupled receptors family 1 profile domain-containing protein n=1 Tax=Steinernema hermaphroditum TaxID=289476 RepID=A0AA39H8D0_9BILA|nr:hypothetical protein QR680_015602 [Steinernema hermaphroditum]